MHDTLNNGAVLEKTLELCGTIVQQSAFQSLKAHIESFLANDEAKELYRTVAEKGEYLHHKQHQGAQIGDDEIAEYEQQREALLRNPLARGFLDAQETMRGVQDTVTKYVTKTLEIGRVPSEADFESCGQGCSCGH